MNQKIIRYGRQTIDNQDIKQVAKVLQSDYLTQGPQVPEFEKKLASYVGAKFAVAFSSGTAALHGACFAAEIGVGDEVITTPLTFAASANCVLYLGGTPVFADIRSDQPLIDINEIKKKISKKTKAIIPVDYSGVPADYDEICALSRKHKLVVIADSAHSLGALYKGRQVGTLADMSVFSFHPVKAITTGEGGLVVTNNKNFYERLILFRTHGITKDAALLKQKNVGPWYYEMQELGFNYRLTEIGAVLGLTQLNKLDRFIKRRRQIAEIYLDAFKDTKGFTSLSIPLDRISAWHLFPIQIKATLKETRRDIFEAFHKQHIFVQVHYIPIHMHPYYRRKFGYKRGDFPLSENYYDREISLPMYPLLTRNDIARVIKVTKEIFARF